MTKRTVLFLCTGDTCRGPMASGYLRKLMETNGIAGFDVRSAGVMTVNGLLATPESIQMLEGEGVDVRRHRSTPVSEDLLRRSDLVLGMTPLHVQSALRMEPGIRGRIFLLKEFARSDLKKVQIDDPMGNTLEIYKRVFAEIRDACKRLVKATALSGETKKEPTKRGAKKKTPKRAASKKVSSTSKTKKKAASKKPAKKAVKKAAGSKVKAGAKKSGKKAKTPRSRKK